MSSPGADFRICSNEVAPTPGPQSKPVKVLSFHTLAAWRLVPAAPLHDGSLTGLEELLDPARRDAEYEPKGWNPPGVTKSPVVQRFLFVSEETLRVSVGRHAEKAKEAHSGIAAMRSLRRTWRGRQ